ncbi:MAG: chloramphenicol acetyltransferase [Candidatus Pedobacter colombiensis]|uniref:Chloramphenicol acetyltransferase n=1 Tax=Candidatus Pedobacter colombiensis TaxID=3121371 RepID=A0AAJ5WC98_9SPHI|nr:chloramphenicol acetyltransferase [Pedobacter sp.]WEK21011.1 MAG: chloramphenicol acetyltransferase [Pedobacter sp.]
MKKELAIDRWKRKEHFEFFRKFEEPFFGITTKIDCTKAYRKAKESGQSFFLYYLYQSLKAVNAIEEFKYRIEDEKVMIYDQINASATINRSDDTFGFSYIYFNEDPELFYNLARQEMNRVSKSTQLFPLVSGDDVIHYSAIPWIDFTSLSHARSFSFKDSVPKISFGKLMETNGKREMSVSVHVHHALMDGYHVGKFIAAFQEFMNS